MPGRYVLRNHADEDALRVLVVATLGAPERRRLGRRRSRRAAPEPPPTPVPTSRATVIRGQAVDEALARAWMVTPHDQVASELAELNRALHLHRVAAADPGVRPVGLDQAIAVRVGFGAGEEVSEGRWTEAVEPGEERTPRRGQRTSALGPQERLAALLGGRDAALACEELALDARASLDGGRPREAALQLRVGLEAALAELEAFRDQGDLAQRLAGLAAEREAVGAAANAALRNGLDADTAAGVERVLGRVEAALRARVAHSP